MTKLLIKNAKVLINRELTDSTVLAEDGKIKINPDLSESEVYEVIDAKGQYLLPGFIDIHTHGGLNVDVNAATPDDYLTLGQFFAKQGTTSYLASVLTDTEEKTLWCIEQIKEGMKLTDCAQLLGAHLEGPFLSVEYKGSMPEHLLQTGNVDLFNRYYEAGQDAIKYITIAPELDGALELIKNISDKVAVALGHSAATYDIAMQAIENGARAITHTFNAMRLFHQHEPALMGAALESNVYCEAICDGLHLHPGSVRMLLKCKGFDYVAGITDSIMAAGLPDGPYKLGVNDIVVKNGDARLANADVRAGSTLRMELAFKNILQFTGASVEKVSQLLSENPAKVIRVFDQKGSIEEGKDADFVLLDTNYDVQKTIVGGRIVYSA